MTNSLIFSLFDPLDPMCGSGSFLSTSVGVADAFYNKQPLARLAAEEESSDCQVEEIDSRLQRLATTLLLDDDDVAAKANVRVGKWSDAEQLFGVTAFDRVMTSPALDLCTVDTLHVILPIKKLIISPHHQLKIARARVNEDNRVLWKNSDGSQVVGFKATWNGNSKKQKWHGSPIYIEIKKLRRGWVDGDNIGCIIQFSLPGVIGKGDNSWPLNKILAQGAVTLVQDILRDIGITVDLLSAKVVRCDLNRNMVLDDSFKRYQPLYNALEQPRTKKTRHEDTGIECTNKSQSSLFYDKIERMKKQGLPTDHLPQNLGRLEWQIQRARNVRKKLGIRTVQDLLDNWDALPALYLEHKESLFRYDVAALQAPQPRLERRRQDTIQAQISNLVRWCCKHNISFDLDLDNLEVKVRQGDIAGYARAIKGVTGIGSKRADDAVSRMRKAFWREMFKNPDFVRWYNEVRAKAEGGRCWPFLSVAAQQELNKHSSRKLSSPI